MDFLSRFKGRTNFVTKEGISSLISESSTPIGKDKMYSFESPKTKEKPLATDASPRNRNLVNPRAPLKVDTVTSPKKLTKAPSVDPQQLRSADQSPTLKLKLNTGPYFYGEEDQIAYPQRAAYFTPQHRMSNMNEPMSADRTFNQRNLNFSASLSKMGSPRSYISASIGEDRGLRQTMDARMSYKLEDGYYSPMLRPTPGLSNFGDKEKESQDSRLARMSFIERQEKVLSKYKAK